MKTLAQIPYEALEKCAALLRVMGHPYRLRLIEILLEHDCTVGELAAELDLPQAAVSQHLNYMKAHGLLTSLREGKCVYYSVANPHAANVIACIRKHGTGK